MLSSRWSANFLPEPFPVDSVGGCDGLITCAPIIRIPERFENWFLPVAAPALFPIHFPKKGGSEEMMSRNKLSQAIFWGLAASATTLQAQDEQNNQDENSREIERIVVTATKTEEVDLQAAPVTVQAIGAEELDQQIIEVADVLLVQLFRANRLDQQNIGNFDDLRNSVPG